MKRWSNIAAVVGFLIVLAFVAERFLGVRTLWATLSWTDLRDMVHDLGGFGLLIFWIVAILLALFAIPWGGYLFWKEIRLKTPEDKVAEPQHSVIVRGRHVVEIAVFSVVIAFAAMGFSKMNTPGWFVAFELGNLARRHDFDLDLRVFLLLPFVIDGAICFVILWGAYLLWMRSRQERSR